MPQLFRSIEVPGSPFSVTKSYLVHKRLENQITPSSLSCPQIFFGDAHLSIGELIRFPKEILGTLIFGDNDRVSIFEHPNCQQDSLLGFDKPYQMKGTMKSLGFGGIFNWVLIYGAPDAPSESVVGFCRL